MADNVSFRTPSGGNPVNVVTALKASLTSVAREDRLYAADRQKGRIIARTNRGIDFNGRQFTKYSPAYEKKRVKSGRSATVNLVWSGLMLQALVTRADPGSMDFTVGIYNKEGVRAAAHNSGEGHMPERRFVDASASDINEMAKDITERMLARANQTLLNAA